MPCPILVDTDVLVDYLRGHPAAMKFVKSHTDRIILSSIVVAELYSGVKGSQEQERLDEFIACFRVVGVDADVAKAGGLLRRDYGKSHGLGLADAILAATATAEAAELCTLNVRHYPMMTGLQPAYRKN